MNSARFSTGVPALDELLGGGLLPGTLTIAMGATGIGKTQLGIQFANAGKTQEGRRGIIFDMTSRGDSQSHAEYARRMAAWRLQEAAARGAVDLKGFFNSDRVCGDYLHVFDYQGRRVTRRDLEFETWRQWQAELVAKLSATIAFFYGNFVRGAQRAVVDGVEPAERASESIQLELFEYVYHQILRKEPEWVARDLFRQDYLANAQAAAQHVYDHRRLACLLLYTSKETMLDDLISRQLDEGDLLANANTILYLGKIRNGAKLGRGLYVAKHRGSACQDEIAEYGIEAGGLVM